MTLEEDQLRTYVIIACMFSGNVHICSHYCNIMILYAHICIMLRVLTWMAHACLLHTAEGESLFGGMERWNGIVEWWNSGSWNSGMTTPTERSCVTTITHSFVEN